MHAHHICQALKIIYLKKLSEHIFPKLLIDLPVSLQHIPQRTHHRLFIRLAKLRLCLLHLFNTCCQILSFALYIDQPRFAHPLSRHTYDIFRNLRYIAYLCDHSRFI